MTSKTKKKKTTTMKRKRKPVNSQGERDRIVLALRYAYALLVNKGWCQNRPVAGDGRISLDTALMRASKRYPSVSYGALRARATEKLPPTVFSIGDYNDAPHVRKDRILRLIDRAVEARLRELRRLKAAA